MRLLPPQDFRDFVWLEARDFRPALFTTGHLEGQISDLGEHIDAKVGSCARQVGQLFSSSRLGPRLGQDAGGAQASVPALRNYSAP